MDGFNKLSGMNNQISFGFMPKIGNVNCTEINVQNEEVSIYKNSFIALDLETTGLDAKKDNIIEVAAIFFENGVPSKKFVSLVSIRGSIPSKITYLTGITDDMLSYAKSENVVFEELIAFINECNAPICAHNAKFDVGFLRETFKRLGIDAEFSYIDTLALAKQVKRLPKYNLNYVASIYSLVNREAHRAESDANICGELFLNLIDEV